MFLFFWVKKVKTADFVMNKHIICRRNRDSSTRVAQFKLGNMCYERRSCARLEICLLLIKNAFKKDTINFNRFAKTKFPVAFREGKFGAMHSGLSSEERTLLASEFSQSTILVLFCTSVLEMGIDKDNFATMVNVGPFHSIESLLQRAGRAGRRGQRTNIIVLYADQKSDYKDKAKDSGKETELILGMQYSVRMLLATTTCRRAYLLRYMEDADALAGRVLSGQFGCCDNCLDKTPDVDCGYELA